MQIKEQHESKRVSQLAESILDYCRNAHIRGGSQSGYGVALGCGLLDDPSRLARVTLANTGSGHKLARGGLSIVEAIEWKYDITPTQMATALVDSARTGIQERYKDQEQWPQQRLELRARMALGLWLISMGIQAKVLDVIRGDGSLASSGTTHMVEVNKPASVAIVRTTAKGKRRAVKLFPGVGDNTDAAMIQADEWLKIKGKPGDEKDIRKALKAGDEEKEYETTSSREPYYLVEKGGRLEGKLTHTSPTPFPAWTKPVDSDGRRLLNGRGFQLDERMMNAPWVHAVNRLESVAYRINQDMLDLIEQFKDRRGFIGATNKKKRTNNLAIEAAYEIGSLPFYQRAFVDFRGRTYLSKSKISYQGGDLPRSLIDLAQGEPLTTQGFHALLLHAVNCHGDFDSLGRRERIDVGHRELSTYIGYGLDPAGSVRSWHDDKIEKPFSFIRACIELANAWDLQNKTINPDHISHLLVEQDGSNNGLQWQAIMMGDKDLAEKTNLLGGPKQDLYSIVGEALVINASKAELRAVAKTAALEYGYGAGPRRIAKDLRENAIEKPNKYQYLNTLDLDWSKGKRDYQAFGMEPIAQAAVDAIRHVAPGSVAYKQAIQNWYRDHMTGSKPSAGFKERYGKNKGAANAPPAIARVIKTILGVDTPTRAFYDFGDLSRPFVATEEQYEKEHALLLKRWVDGEYIGDRAITYVTPAGFPVHIEKQKELYDKVELLIDSNIRVGVRANYNTGEPNVSGMKTSSLANSIHSMDAAHVHRILYTAEFDVVTIHDAVACHANNAESLRAIVMQTMKDIADQWPMRILTHQGSSIGFQEDDDGLKDWLGKRLSDPAVSEKEKQWLQKRLLDGGFRRYWPALKYEDGPDGSRIAPVKSWDGTIHKFPENPCVNVDAQNAFS